MSETHIVVWTIIYRIHGFMNKYQKCFVHIISTRLEWSESVPNGTINTDVLCFERNVDAIARCSVFLYICIDIDILTLQTDTCK